MSTREAIPTASPTPKTVRAHAARLRSDQGGAIMILGIFFAIFALGMLYYMVGIGATLYYRERLQDAADSSAFASAVVHARGMNTLALINLVMAALLSVLVTLRLIGALILIAQVILYAFSWLGGATAAVASALEVLRQTVNSIEEVAQPIITNVNKVLKMTGDVVRVITPLGANISVMGKVANKYPEALVSVAIPPRITLPAEDDEFPVLCGKAGYMAAELAMLPLKPILPGFVRSKMSGAIAKLTEKGSMWFCDGSDPPKINLDEELKEDYPPSDQMKACTSNDKNNEDSHKACRDAERIEGLSAPDPKTGECRVGQDVCVLPEASADTMVENADGQLVPFTFSEDSYCGSEGKGVKVTATDCATVEDKDKRPFPDNRTPYGQRLARARTDCVPGKDKSEFWWTERQVEVTWEMNPTTKQWEEVEQRELSPSTAVGRPPGDRVPCQWDSPTGTTLDVNGMPVTYERATPTWNKDTDLRQPVCKMDEAIPLNAQGRVTTQRTEVLQILGCTYKGKLHEEVKVKGVNLAADKASTKGPIGDHNDPTGKLSSVAGFEQLGLGGGTMSDAFNKGMASMTEGNQMNSSEQAVPFKFEEGHLLGTSDMQIRSLVIGAELGDKGRQGGGEHTNGQSVHNHAEHVVGMTRWRDKNDDMKILREASELYGRLAVAQAEYYFDAVHSKSSDFAKWDPAKIKDTKDYLWYMGWTARMRRFRLIWTVDGENADGESKQGSSGNGGAAAGGDGDMLGQLGGGDLLQGFGGQDASSVASNGPNALCSMSYLQDLCGQLTEVTRSLDGIFIH